jgi:Mrp family chromosome partitioning ATPase
MASCNHDCANCEQKGNCSDEIIKSKPNDASHIKRIIGVLSGKGGVGKSFVTSALAAYLSRSGLNVGILDADVTGPSIPKAFGIKEKAYGENNLIFPCRSNWDIEVMSANLLLDNETDPIIWRGPLVANLVKQFFEDVAWGDLDVLLIDMPPGTGDVALTIFQSLPVDDLIIVTSPQDLVSLIVSKAIKMADLMHIHVLGVIENMSYLVCPKCDEHIKLFGESHLEEFAKQMNFDILARLPLNSKNTELMDKGEIEKLILPEIQEVVDKIKGE